MKIKDIAEKILDRKIEKKEGYSISEIEKIELQLEISIPKPLKYFYLSIGKIDLFADGFQHFAKPNQLYLKDEKLIFLEENQSVVYWGIDINNPKIVFQTTNIEEEEIDWYEEDILLDKFIELMIYFQCVMSDVSYHEITKGGFEYFASLDIEEYKQNIKVQSFISNLNCEWENVAKDTGISIYWKKDSILSYFTDKQGNINDMILVCTKNKVLLDELINEFGFGEL